MTTLTTAPLAPLLNRLFEEAAKASPETSPVLASLSEDEFTRFLRSKTGYFDFYGQLKDVPLEISRETGTLLYMLARSSRARNIVEFGTSFGISTLHLAAALREQRWRQADHRPSRADQGGAGSRRTSRLAVSSIWWRFEWETPSRRCATICRKASSCCCSMAHKALYLDILSLVEGRLRPGALVVADNADFNPEYVARMRSPANGYLSTPFGGDVELFLRIG